MKSGKKLSGTRALLACALLAIGAAGAWAAPARIYKVTIADDIVGGSVTASKTSELAANEKVKLAITPEKGYEFDSVSVTSVNDGKAINPSISFDGQYSFRMPKGDVTLTATFLKQVATKAKPDAVGDIVLNDGTAVAFENAGKMTKSQKDKAMAVIFYVGTECSNDGRKRTLGVGLHEDSAAWHPSDEKQTGLLGVSITTGEDIEPIKVKLSVKALNKGNVYEASDEKKEKKIHVAFVTKNVEYDTDSYVFSGDKDGSDNLEQISAFLKKKGFPDDTAPVVGAASFKEENYPAFYFAKNYKNYKHLHPAKEIESSSANPLKLLNRYEPSKEYEANVGEAFKDGWYLPTIVELFQMWKSKDKVNEALAICDGCQFFNKFADGTSQYKTFLSSSQYEDIEENGEVFHSIGGVGGAVYSLFFGSGKCGSTGKGQASSVCAIREF